MSADLFTQFHQLLAEERSAIIRADSARVLEIAGSKEALMKDLVAAGGRRDAAPWQGLQTAMRQSLLLLVHARACAKDVVDTLGARAPGYNREAQAASFAPGRRVSLKG